MPPTATKITRETPSHHYQIEITHDGQRRTLIINPQSSPEHAMIEKLLTDNHHLITHCTNQQAQLKRMFIIVCILAGAILVADLTSILL